MNRKEINGDGLKYITWLTTDSQNIRDFGYRLFGMAVDIDSEDTKSLVMVLENFIKEVEYDITKVKEELDLYKTPQPNENSTNVQTETK